MKKLLLLTLLTALLLTSCNDKPDNTPEPPVKDTPSVSITEDTPKETPSDTPDSPSTYEEFEYKVTAKDYDSVRSLSYEEMAKEFLSAICLGDREALAVYMQGETIDELMKLNAEVIIKNGRTVSKSYGDYPVDEYLLDVRMIISKSKSSLFPIGIRDYVLNLSTAGMYPVQYFGSPEGFDAFNGSEIPSKATSPALYNAYLLTNEIFRNYGIPSALPDVKASFDRIMHTAVHTRMAMNDDFIFTTTTDAFKEYVSLQFGCTDETLLQDFANELTKAPYATSDENGVYTVCCAHGYSSLTCDLTSVELKDGTHVFTYAVFADSAHTVKCREIKFIFEENKDSEIMTLAGVEARELNSLAPDVVSV